MGDLDDLLEHLRKELDDIWESVEQLRDEAQVQANLAKAEVKDELELLEKKYEEYKGKMKLVREEINHENEEILDAARSLGQELSNAYRKIKDILSK